MPASAFSALPSDAIFSVSEYLDLVNGLLQPTKVTVRGEVTQLQERGSAVYFTLSDTTAKATLNGLIWRDKLWRLGIDLKVGGEYACVGAGNVYKPTGRLSFLADTISPLGEGALRAAFEKLKLQLEKEGYFAAARKRTLPAYIEKITVLTSAQGEALRDFQAHVGRFGQQIELIDIRVEGVRAIESIVAAFRWLNTHPLDSQVIVLTRGGGSLESLQAFNSREVAEAIFASKIPVVSAVGHERDITIADFVADVRASTPTDAGKILSRDWSLASEQLRQVKQTLLWRLQSRVQSNQAQLQRWQDACLHAFQAQLQQKRDFLFRSAQQSQPLFQRFQQRVAQMQAAQERWFLLWSSRYRDRRLQGEALQKSIYQQFSSVLHKNTERIHRHEEFFTAVSPARRLQQGYVWMRDSTGKIVKSLHQVAPGQTLEVVLQDGMMQTEIKKVVPKEKV